jgi:hypothetical protein
MSKCSYCGKVHEYPGTKCAVCGKSSCEIEGPFYVLGSDLPDPVVLCKQHYQEHIKRLKKWLSEKGLIINAIT